MLNELPNVPPCIPLLIDEVVRKGGGDLFTMRKRLKALLPELQNQSEAYIALKLQEDSRHQASPTRLEIYADGGLDLFDSSSSCQDTGCRILAAEQFSRSLGLLADNIWLSDTLSARFERFGRATNRKLDLAINDALVLLILEPLISAGIVKFRTPVSIICRDCYEEFESQTWDLAGALSESYADQFALEKISETEYILSTGSLYEPELVSRIQRKEAKAHQILLI